MCLVKGLQRLLNILLKRCTLWASALLSHFIKTLNCWRRSRRESGQPALVHACPRHWPADYTWCPDLYPRWGFHLEFSMRRKGCVSSCHQGWLLEVGEALKMTHNLRKCFCSQVISCTFCHSSELNPFFFFFQMYIVIRCKAVYVVWGETPLGGEISWVYSVFYYTTQAGKEVKIQNRLDSIVIVCVLIIHCYFCNSFCD